MIRVLIADDHQLLLEGISQALNLLPDISVVGAASDGKELVAKVEELGPDVLVIDQEMPKLTGIGALKKMVTPPPTIIVTMHADEAHRAKAEAAGAVGFLSKSAPLPTLAAAVRAAAAGEV